MSSVGTFGTFTAARLAIYASQKGLSVTGNNIANINSTGYTRQVLKQVSLKTGGADRYANKYDIHVGEGVLCTGVSQIRDPYLDIRYRTEMSTVGYTNTTLDTLSGLAAILDEVGDGSDDYGIISAAFDKFGSALLGIQNGAGQKDTETMLEKSAEQLTLYFRQFAQELQNLKDNKVKGLRQDIDKVNNILTSIRELNDAIRKSEIHGDNALEMRDDRNVLIDELSEFVKIDVVYSMEDIGAGRQVEKLTIKLADANPDVAAETDEVRLVDGIYAAQFVTPKKNPNPATGKYLDENGDPTDDPLNAFQEFDGNYNLGLSKLLDEKGREWNEGKTEPLTLKPDSFTPPFASLADLKTALAGASEKNPLVLTDKDGTKVVITGIKDGKLTDVPPANPTSVSGVFTTVTYSQVVEQFDDNDLYGSLQASRELLTEEGEFASVNKIKGPGPDADESAAIKRGIPYYQKSLDLLAKKFAETFNNANKGYLVDEHGNYLKNTGTDEKPKYETLPEITYYRKKADGTVSTTAPAAGDEDNWETFSFTVNNDMNEDEKAAFKLAAPGKTVEQYLEDNGVKPVGGNLFSIRGDSDVDTDADGNSLITASNINVAAGWSTGRVHVVTSFIKPFDGSLENSTQSSNIDHMIAMLDKDQVYNPQDWYNKPVNPGDKDDIAQSEYLFNGSFTEMLNNMFVVLGKDQDSFGDRLDTSYNAAVELDTSRDGVSGVDLNDEAMSLMQYSKSLNAAYRLMTTIDEALDRLINNTGVVGR